MHCPLRSMPVAGALLAFGLQPVAAQDEDAFDRAPERCISLTRLDRTEVIDDRTIIFHMRGGVTYLNYLARECPGLEREERFMYSPTSNRLCDVDTVTVLEQWGFGLTRGFTCALGEFHPISELDLEDLRRTKEQSDDQPSRARGGEGEFEVVPVEPSAEEDEDAEVSED